MNAGVTTLLTILSVLSFAGCYANRYQWNLTHATVTAKPALSPRDVEEITRLVTRATLSPMESIVALPDAHGRQQVSVIAAESTGPLSEFLLEKIGTEWHVISHELNWDR
jgi:hypothetical protein